MTSVSFRTRANSLVILYATLGSNTTSVSARIDALEIETSLRLGALFVLCTLGVAAGERISKKIGRTRADCTMVLSKKHKYFINPSRFHFYIHLFNINLRGCYNRRRFRMSRTGPGNGSWYKRDWHRTRNRIRIHVGSLGSDYPSIRRDKSRRHGCFLLDIWYLLRMELDCKSH